MKASEMELNAWWWWTEVFTTTG